MPSKKKQIAGAGRSLEKLREKHAKVVEKTNRVYHRLDGWTRKLRRLEVRITETQQRIYELSQANGDVRPVDRPTLRRAYMVYNPTSGGTGKGDKALQSLIETLRTHGIQAEVGFKTDGKVGRKLTREAIEQKYDLIIAAGGDGTIEAVASQMIGTEVTLGILPIGTQNNLARELGVPLALDQACELLAAGITRRIDVGRVCAGTTKDGVYFLESSALGPSAEAIPMGQNVRKGRLAKVTAALRKLFESAPDAIEIELDSHDRIKANSRLVTISNAPMMGTNLLIAPDAKMDDGLLDVAVYGDMTKSDLALYFMGTTKGRRVHDARVRFYRARNVIIRATGALPIVSDKDEIPDQQELQIEVLPRALSAIVGNGIALTLPVESVPSVPPLTGQQPEAPEAEKAAAEETKPVSEPVPA